MKITKADLDTRFCDLVEGYTNPETPREFIVSSEKEFEMLSADLDNMSDEQITEYINFIDYLWTK